MSIKFLDPDHQLPSPARAELAACFGLLMSAEYQQSYELLSRLTKNDNDLVRGFAFLYLGDLYHFQWDFKLSAASYAKAGELLTACGHGSGSVMTELRVADILVDEVDSTNAADDRKDAARAEGARRLQQAVADADRIGNDFVRGFAAHYLALFATEQGDYAEAVNQANRAIEIRERIGDTDFAPSSMALLARARAELGEYEAAVALAEETYRLQMDRNLRGAALRTLAILAYINEQWHLRRTNELASQFTAVEPIARTPFLLGDYSEEDMAVAAHSMGPTPLMQTRNHLDGNRQTLVSDAGNLVMMLAS